MAHPLSFWDSSQELPYKSFAVGSRDVSRPPAQGRKRGRASKACMFCRARKIRCDVSERSAPCTNCKFYRENCIGPEDRQRQKRALSRRLDWEGSSVAGFREMSAEKSLPVDEFDFARFFQSNLSDLDNLSDLVNTPKSILVQGDEVEREQCAPHQLHVAPGSEFPAEELGRTSNVWTAQRLPGSQYLQNTRIARPWLPSTRNTSTRAVQGFQQESQQSTKYLLPAYFKQLSGGVRESDVKYLGESGALTVPEDSLRNELLESFIDYVHGYAPVLDLQTFLETIDQTDIEQEGLSLLVFQAVMFAGTAYVDITHLLSAGFVSRRDARRVFFEKAKLLYQYNCEEDEISCIQALLLMSYWYENPDDPEHNWPWMTDALTLCEHMGLKYNLKRLCTDVKQQRLRKRIWWSCLMRERMVALGTGFPTHVNDKEYHASLLTLDDFDLTPLSDQIQCVSPKCAVARDIEKQRQLAIMCVNMSKLCLCIGKIIKAQYDVSSPFPQPIPQDSNINTIQMLPQKLVPKKGPRKLADIKKCDMELTSWLGELWEQGFYIQNTLSDLRDNRGPVAVHRAILYMVYFNAVGALHRPLIFSLRRPTVGSYLEKLCQASMEKVRLATSQITRIAEELDSLNLVQFLPAIAVTALMPAMVGHLLDIKSVDRCTVGLEGFCTCMAMLQYMRHLYGCADFAVNLLDVAIFKAAATVLPTDISLRNAKTKVQVIDLIKRAFVVLTPESLASTPFVPSNLLESQVDYLAQSLPFYMYSDPFEQLTDVGNV